MFRDALNRRLFRDENKDWNRLEEKTTRTVKTWFTFVLIAWVFSALFSVAVIGVIIYVIIAVLQHNGLM